MALAWILSISAGLGYLQKYANAPASQGSPSEHWPADTHFGLDSKIPTLLLFAHPRCPCTRATIGELALLMARCQRKIHGKVVFFEPEDQADAWAKTDLWRSAEAIPGVKACIDKGGAEARRFQIKSSGHALLFDPNGNLIFSGGITGSRGHSGDNPGRSAIVARVAGEHSPLEKTPVFGCSLLDRD